MMEWYDIIFLGGMACLAAADLFETIWRNLERSVVEEYFWFRVWILLLFIGYCLWRIT